MASWACYYGSADKTSELLNFDLCVLAESGQDPDLLRKQGRKVLVYVSLGEIAGDSSYLDEARSQGLLTRFNENWNSWVVDIRDPLWREMLLERIIPRALERGYDGLFFDTLDSPIDMQRRDPDRFKGTERSCVELIKAIRSKYPKLLLCQNRGFEIIGRTAPFLDFLLIEGLSSSMKLGDKQSSKVSEQDREYLLAKTGQAMKANSGLKVISLDYAFPDEAEAISKACEFSRKQGFIPYVSTPELNEVFIHADCL